MVEPSASTLISPSDSAIGQAIAARLAPQNAVIVLSEGEDLSAVLAEASARIVNFVHCGGADRLSLADAAPADVVQVFQASVFAATATIRTLLKRSVNGGALRSIVFVTGIGGQFGGVEDAVAAAAMGAINSLSRSLAVELAPRVRVNSIACGAMQADATGYLLGSGHPDDAAAMAEYLISDRARWITGQHFVVDGGKTAH